MMRNKKESFVELLKYYFESYLPITRGLSEKTITSYKATFRLLIEYLPNFLCNTLTIFIKCLLKYLADFLLKNYKIIKNPCITLHFC